MPAAPMEDVLRCSRTRRASLQRAPATTAIEETVQLLPPAPLPEDCLAQIFSDLARDDVVSCSIACTQWREVCKRQEIWQNLFLADFCRVGTRSRLSSNEMGGSAVAVGCYSEQAKAEDAQRLLGLEGATTDWMTIYQRRCEVDRCWRDGESTDRMLEGHTDQIRCAQLEGSTLVTASGSMSHTDCTIRVWDLDTGMLRQLLRGHMGPIWCMVYDPASGRVASGSEDYTVRYWDAQAGNCVSLQDPDSAVRSIHMDTSSGLLVAGTEFGRLLMWHTSELDKLLKSGVKRVRRELERVGRMTPGPACHQAPAARRSVVVDGTHHVRTLGSAEEGKAVTAIQVQGGLCASTSSEFETASCVNLWDVSGAEDGGGGGGGGGGWRLARRVEDVGMQSVLSMSFETPLGMLVGGCGDRSMRVWDLETGSRLHLLEGHTAQITAHQFDATTLASASLSGQVRVWDLRSGGCIHVFEHGAPVSAFQFDGNRMASGTGDGRTLLWDLTSGQLVKQWQGHNEGVRALVMGDYDLVSAGADSAVCVRCFLPDDLKFNQREDNLCLGLS